MNVLSKKVLVCAVFALCCGCSAFSQTCGIKCGQERWAIKTLTDSEAATVGNAAPESTTISTLIGEQAPAQLTDSRSPLEQKRFHLTALIIGWKIEAPMPNAPGNTPTAAANALSSSVPDHDFHIVIADPQDTTKQMIMEVPYPKCQAVCSSKFLSAISAVRTQVSQHLGQPTSSVRALTKPWLVEITGPAFFDFEHGQTGLAPNCIEIHPVMEINFVKQQGTKVTPHPAGALQHHCGIR